MGPLLLSYGASAPVAPCQSPGAPKVAWTQGSSRRILRQSSVPSWTFHWNVTILLPVMLRQMGIGRRRLNGNQ
jgi:hypothetical protein